MFRNIVENTCFVLRHCEEVDLTDDDHDAGTNWYGNWSDNDWHAPAQDWSAKDWHAQSSGSSSSKTQQGWSSNDWQSAGSRSPKPPDHAPADQSWVKLDFNIENWKFLLDSNQVDKYAQYELFLLAQYSKEGARHANSVIAHFTKALSDGRAIHNPSGFFHSSCLKSRHKLEADAGQSSWRD